MQITIGARAVAVIVAAVVAVGAGVAFASIPDSAGVIHACIKGEDIRVIDNATASCKQQEQELTWNRVGPQGIQGVQGIQGLQGNPGTNGVKGDPGDRGPSDAYFYENRTLRALSPTAVVPTTVASLTVPNGDYIVNFSIRFKILGGSPATLPAGIGCDLVPSGHGGDLGLSILQNGDRDIWELANLTAAFHIDGSQGNVISAKCFGNTVWATDFDNVVMSAIQVGTVHF